MTNTLMRPGTPLPWKASPVVVDAFQILGPDGSMVADILKYGPGPRDGAYIVAAANAYPGLVAERAALVDALRKIARLTLHDIHNQLGDECAACIAKDALAALDGSR